MKLTKIILIFVLTAALAAPLFLAGCGSDEADADSAAPSDKTADTTGVTWDTADAPDTTAQTTDPDYDNPLEGLETISEDTSVSNDPYGISLRELKFYKNQKFEKDGATYYWLEFYNACVRGELKLTDPDVVTYAEECLEFFEENDIDREVTHAKTLLDAAKGLAG